tara:strand:- start:23 stop:568 length:546 start_codon:yes stop_codon:yes gene_type:complete
MTTPIKTFYSIGTYNMLVSTDILEKRETYYKKMSALMSHHKIGILGLGTHALNMMKYWKGKYDNTFSLIGFDWNVTKAKALWSNSNLMSDHGLSIPAFVDIVRTPASNDDGEYRKNSSVFILAADTKEENDEYFEALEEDLYNGDIVIDYMSKTIMFKQNCKEIPYLEYPFDFLNAIISKD